MSDKDKNRVLYLASGSPRRKELLALLGNEFSIVKPDIPECKLEEETPEEYVRRLSLEKAQAGIELVSEADCVVIGSDTIVVHDGLVLEKPEKIEDSIRMLSSLSGSQHQVMTAVTVTNRNKAKTCLVITDVWFREITEQEIRAYWASGEPCDKAGSYGIQGIGGRFVSRIEGSYHAVVGLPLMETDQLLHEFI
ncbi:Maf family protein [Vibrio hannami]|uniref:Maf family protein n=1 Tax=Vibrio hannami TaxID=2717094 RepID=UPI00240F3F23|nr:Maf family protein [Vibrio hannami]MDG3084782.1 Maf family protein [Vibrio hannami]